MLAWNMSAAIVDMLFSTTSATVVNAQSAEAQIGIQHGMKNMNVEISKSLAEVLRQLRAYESLFESHQEEHKLTWCCCDFCMLYRELNDESEEGEH